MTAPSADPELPDRPPEAPIEGLINKEVLFRYAGEDLFFDLSQALFSSYQIDTGSRLLLKGLLPLLRNGLPTRREGNRLIADIGCGTGILGIAAARALGRYAPRETARLRMVFQDRDALAAAFTRHNWIKNGLDPAQARFCRSLALEQPLAETGEDQADLILCNWPAKAGKPVLESFLHRSAAVLQENGRAAIVIVKTLAGELRGLLEAGGFPILFTESGSDHQVFHFGRPAEALPPPASLLAPYIRSQAHFSAPPPLTAQYTLETALNLPNFDTRSRALDLAAGLAASASASERIQRGAQLHWNPGQGHMPRMVAPLAGPGKAPAFPGTGPAPCLLASRDRLQLLISRHNLNRAAPQKPHPEIRLYGVPCLSALPEQLLQEQLHQDPAAHPSRGLALITLPLQTGPAEPDPAALHSLARQLLRPGGSLLVYGRSAALASLAKNPGPLRRVLDRKKKGSRALLYQL